MRFVNVAVSDIASLLGCHAFESKRKAIDRIRRRGGVRWRPGKLSSSGRYDEFAELRALPASREFEDGLNNDPLRFVSRAKGRDKLIAIEEKIRSDALGMAINACPKLISSFVNTEFGKAMESWAVSRVEAKYGWSVQDRQRSYQRTWTHPREKSIKVCLVGFVDATFRDSCGNKGVLEIKCRRFGIRPVRQHEMIQLRTYLTLAKVKRGILVQSYGKAIHRKFVRQNDDWFYKRVKPAIDRVALHVAKTKKVKTRKSRCHSKGNA